MGSLSGPRYAHMCIIAEVPRHVCLAVRVDPAGAGRPGTVRWPTAAAAGPPTSVLCCIETGIDDVESTRVIPLSADLALSAADVGLRHGLATADAIVYATALSAQAELVTRDAHFRGLPGAAYVG